jgi:hypothetical protein
MKAFIFVTAEGTTYPPENGSSSEEIDNLQVLGIEMGETIEEAFNNLINNNPWISAAGYSDVTGYPLEHDKPAFFLVQEAKEK